MTQRESMAFDAVGAGVAALSAVIKFKQSQPEATICVLEKGAEVGAHVLSGAVIDPIALDELLPDWRASGCPLADVPVTENHHWFLTDDAVRAMPHWLLPPFMSNTHALRATKGAVRRVREMTYDNAEDYLIRAQEALHNFGGVAARKEATRQFLDEKSYKPGHVRQEQNQIVTADWSRAGLLSSCARPFVSEF
jgi:flavin-dependent dehydrogenase